MASGYLQDQERPAGSGVSIEVEAPAQVPVPFPQVAASDSHDIHPVVAITTGAPPQRDPILAG